MATDDDHRTPRGEQDEPPAPALQLTAEAKRELNALVARGVPLGEALTRVRAGSGVWQAPAPPVVRTPALQGRALATSAAEVDAYYDALQGRLAAIGVVPREHAAPIRPADLERIQGRARLPYAYVAFLRRFGGARCRLWSHDHLAVERAYLLTMQPKARALGERLGHPLPAGAWAILGRLAAVYHYLPGDGGVDEPVHAICEDAPDGCRAIWASVLGWVDHLADDAVRAWDRGYFRNLPGGTQA